MSKNSIAPKAHTSRSVAAPLQLELSLDFLGEPPAAAPGDIETFIRAKVGKRSGFCLSNYDVVHGYLSARGGVVSLDDFVALAARSEREVSMLLGSPSRPVGGLRLVKRRWRNAALATPPAPPTRAASPLASDLCIASDGLPPASNRRSKPEGCPV